MIREQDADFQEAARHHDELSERQLEVLVLIDRGLTNGEIAESLDISLDGAKWYVSEILTKLGLPSRDSAADYYRWHRSPMQRIGRHARALAFGSVGVGAAGAAAAGIAVIAVTFSSGEEARVPNLPVVEDAQAAVAEPTATEAPGADTGAFYLEASAVVEDAGSEFAAATTRYTTIRQWFQPPNLWRWEIDWTSEVEGDRSQIIVFDGSELVIHNLGEAGGYVTFDVGEAEQPLLPGSILFGKVPGENADDYIALLESMFRTGVPSPSSAAVLNGRPVILIEQPPTLCSESEGCMGRTRLWLHEESMVVLRRETDIWPDGAYLDAVVEVTEFISNVEHDPALFVFEPPPGVVGTTISAKPSMKFTPNPNWPPGSAALRASDIEPDRLAEMVASGAVIVDADGNVVSNPENESDTDGGLE
jgi:DNA-binding CsgD family transcriptional regulator/outer membrane lipoprotein-sorting protein